MVMHVGGMSIFGGLSLTSITVTLEKKLFSFLNQFTFQLNLDRLDLSKSPGSRLIIDFQNNLTY